VARRHGAQILCIVLLVVLAVLLVLPILKVVASGFQAGGRFSLFFVINAFAREVYRQGLVNSLMIGLSVTALTALIAVPLALISHRFDFAGKKLFSAVVLVPMILPPFVGAIGLRRMLAREAGPLNLLLGHLGLVDPLSPPNWLGEHAFWAVVVLEALHLYPIFLLNVQAALANIDPTLEQASENLGAGPLRTFFRVTLPLMRPGLFAGGSIVFIWSFTELGTPLMFDFNQVAPVQVFHGLHDIDIRPQPYALVVILLVTSVLVYLVGKLLLGRSSHAMVVKAGAAVRTRRLGALASLAAAAPFIVVFGLAVVPHAGVILLSLAERWQGTLLPVAWTASHHVEALTSPVSLPAVLNSLRYAAMSMIIDLLVGFAVAYVVVRTRAFGRTALDALSMLPLAVPGIVMAFGYIALTRPGGLLAALDPRATDPTVLLVIAYAVRRLPYVVRSSAAGLEQTSVTLEEAARNLGAGALRTIGRITVPLVMANLVAAALLAFSFAVLEVSDSLILAYWPEDYPVTKAIWELSFRLQHGEAIASALGVWGMLLLAGTIFLASRILGKRLGALFRF
jgi:iron(III) transport system permease protein